jgi:hypothetical protein
MLASHMDKFAVIPPCNCGGETRIVMTGYGDGDVRVCDHCALQLVRKLSEDLCQLLTPGGRHG